MNTLRDTLRFGPKVLSTLIAVLGLAACVPTQQGGEDADSDSSADDSDDGGSGAGGDSGGTGGAAADGGESCTEVLACLVACADDACANACYAAGSDAARQKIDALVGCLNDSMCEDDACAQAACGAQIDACVQDAGVPDDPGPPVTQGAVPAELVGDWMGFRGSYHFDESGEYWFVGVLSSDGPCIGFEKIVLTDTGVASASGNNLTLSAQTAQKETHECGGDITTEATAAHTNQYTWSIDGTTLTLVNESGAIEYTKQ
jgi:hypothetical protein